MTKSIRIENADGSTYHKVRLVAQRKLPDGTWVDSEEPVQNLIMPTQMATVGIHDSRRFIVEEYVDPVPPVSHVGV